MSGTGSVSGGGGIGLHANVSMLFREQDPLERPAAAAAAGFDAIECWWPFDDPEPSEIERDRFVRSVRDAGVRVVAMNLYGGDLAAGERGIVSDPGRTTEFARALDAGTGLAAELGCGVLHVLYGNRLLGHDPREQDELAVRQLARASAAARAVGAEVVVEALNPWDNPLFPLRRTAQVLALADRVEREAGERIGCLYDLYHAQRSEGELIATIRRHASRFGHVQLADVPGRGEPGTGEIAFPRVLAALADAGHAGSVGLEYLPTTTTRESLEAVRQLADALAARPTGDGTGVRP